MVLQENNNNLFSRVISKENSKINSSSRVYYGGASGSIPFMWESQPGTPIHTFSYDHPNHPNHKHIIDPNNCNNMNTVNNDEDDFTIPPLTPPPSYYSTANSKLNASRNMKPNPNVFSKSWISMMKSRKLKKGKHHVSPSSSSTASSSSLSSTMSSSFSSWSSLLYSSPSSVSRNNNGKGNQSNHRRSFSCSSESPVDHFGINDREEENVIKNTKETKNKSQNENENEENDEVEVEKVEEEAISRSSGMCFGGKQKINLKDYYGGWNIYAMVKVKKSLCSIRVRRKSSRWMINMKNKLRFMMGREGSSNPNI